MAAPVPPDRPGSPGPVPGGLDPEAPQRAAADPGASVWVAASAGSGKTKVLTDRVLSLLLDGAPPQRILCLTYTRAAAAEMANRLNARLAGWVEATDEALQADLARLPVVSAPETLHAARRLFARVLDTPGGMKIMTLHGFCQSLLRRFPLEAGLAPHFTVAEERDAAELMTAARDDMLESARDGGDAALTEALSVVTSLVHESLFPALMAELARARGRLKRMLARRGGLEGVRGAVYARLGLDPGETPEAAQAAAVRDDAFDGPGLRNAAAVMAASSRKTDRERAAALARWLAVSPKEREETFKSYKDVFLTRTGEVRKAIATKSLCQEAPWLEKVLDVEASRLLRLVERMRAAATARATMALMTVGEALLDAFERRKRDRALLDYDDLILAAGRLLDSDGGAAWVHYKLDGGLDHVLIDEAQDTSPDQWAVVRALTAEFFAGEGAHEDRSGARARTVFAVGDAKQSIYSFQGADPRGFLEGRDHYARRVKAAGGRWRQVGLQVSFRSTAAVLEAVDATFAQAPASDGVILDESDRGHISWRPGQAGLVEVWPPVEALESDAPPPWKPPVERLKGDSAQARLAGVVARRIKAMIGREALESQARPVRAGDILVLVRRRGAFVTELVRALKALSVEVAGVDRMVLTEQMAVMDLMALGRVMLLPEDDLTLACVLKSPLVGLDEDQLFTLAHGRTGRLWTALGTHAGSDCALGRAHGMLEELRGLADRVPPHEFYARVLGRDGGRRRLLSRLGQEAWEAVEEFLSLALAYERGRAPSLQGFLHWLDAGAVEIKRDLEQGGGDAVRVMTVHGSKGLQAPVVFLPDTMQTPRPRPTLLWDGEGEDVLALWPPRAELRESVCRALVESEAAAQAREYRRLLYVAMTRAADRLYVAGWRLKTEPPEDCWYALIRSALAQRAVSVEDPALAADPVMERAEVLRLACPQSAAPAPERLAEEEDSPKPLESWADRPPTVEPSPPRPLAPSRLDEDAPPVHSPLSGTTAPARKVRGDAARRARLRRGRAVHRLLQVLPECAPARRMETARRLLAAPAWGFSPDEALALVQETLAVLDDPAFAPLFAPGSLAEAPLVGMIGERPVSGQVDRLVVSGGSVLVVDYKTDRPAPETLASIPAAYVRQMAAYRAVLQRIFPGRAVGCALLWTEGPRLMAVPDHALDAAEASLRAPPSA